MQETFATTVLLPAALALIMFGLGLTLTPADFARIARRPRAVLIALACQVLLLPLVCFALVKAFGLEPKLAVGMMLLAAAPGGTAANLFSHLAGGDVALNITLTAVNSVLALFTLPLVVGFALEHFMAGGEIGMQTGKVVQVICLVLVPAALGMAVRHRAAGLAARADRPLKIMSIAVLVAMTVGVAYQERARLLDSLAEVGLITTLFCALSLGTGYGASRLLRVEPKQAIASAMEIGLHNVTLAITVALSVLGDATMAVPPAVYTLPMYALAALTAVAFVRRTRAGADAPSGAPADAAV
ncbi:bile acid:sodium symporter family protein [Actinomadura hibisca]|uniref:bile acid:sodium symporter family protein n=1 Tax=Actinomadura hibisca TaxID=68565 RepID=UPI0008299FF3|nr:bile acid:sodium symporter family protein [Actinomadura hibisca]